MPKYVFNPMTLKYEVLQGSRRKRFWKSASVAVLSVGLCVMYFWLYTSVLGLELPKTVLLRKENDAWQSRIAVMDRKLDMLAGTLEGIEDRDDNVYRTIFGMNPISDAVKYSGLVGSGRYRYLDEAGAGAVLKDFCRKQDLMLKRVYVRSQSLDGILSSSLTAGDMASHIPAVPPFLPEKGTVLTSTFGYRTDPVYGGTRFHSGQDFSAKQGTPVYATGDGVVVNAEYSFSGYGNMVVIDHGFGYSTRYAHLSSIDVSTGMKVMRGTKLGGVGRTGKATGSHLHYEVLFRGNPVNPYSFMDLGIPEKEYNAMIERASRHNDG